MGKRLPSLVLASALLPAMSFAAAGQSPKRAPIGERVFDDDALHSYYLYFEAKDLSALQDLGAQVKGYDVRPTFVRARLKFEGRTLDPIAVRYRGDQSLWDCVANGRRRVGVRYPQFGFGQTDICAKFSLKLDFNRFQKGQRLDGLKALNLRSMSKDPTKLHERLGYALFHDLGVVAPRAVHARLFVNDQYWGLFSAVEEIDDRFVRARFARSKGDGPYKDSLYKEAWPDASFPDQRLRRTLEGKKDPNKPADVSDFAAFRDAVLSEGTNAANFRERLARLVDLDYLARYMAVDRAIANFDGVVSCYHFGPGIRHNFYWYREPTHKRFILVPWDLDLVFIYPEPNFWTDNAPRAQGAIPNWNVVSQNLTPIQGFFDPGGQAVAAGAGYPVRPIDSDKFMRLLREATWPEFVTAANDVLERVLTQEAVDRRIDKWSAQIEAAVAQDATLDAEEWRGTVGDLRRNIPKLRRHLQLMRERQIVRD